MGGWKVFSMNASRVMSTHVLKVLLVTFKMSVKFLLGSENLLTGTVFKGGSMWVFLQVSGPNHVFKTISI